MKKNVSDKSKTEMNDLFKRVDFFSQPTTISLWLEAPYHSSYLQTSTMSERGASGKICLLITTTILLCWYRKCENFYIYSIISIGILNKLHLFTLKLLFEKTPYKDPLYGTGFPILGIVILY